MSKCKDCKYNKGICLVCIKDKIFYVGTNFGRGDDKTKIKRYINYKIRYNGV